MFSLLFTEYVVSVLNTYSFLISYNLPHRLTLQNFIFAPFMSSFHLSKDGHEVGTDRRIREIKKIKYAALIMGTEMVSETSVTFNQLVCNNERERE